jgi:hypothetical protein
MIVPTIIPSSRIAIIVFCLPYLHPENVHAPEAKNTGEHSSSNFSVARQVWVWDLGTSVLNQHPQDLRSTLHNTVLKPQRDLVSLTFSSCSG